MQKKRNTKMIISEQGSGIPTSKTIKKQFDDWFNNSVVHGQLPAFYAGILTGVKTERNEIEEIIEEHRALSDENSETESLLTEILRRIEIRKIGYEE